MKEFSYFPGCSLASSARESNQALLTFCDQHGMKLRQIDDWNCCGSSSVHSVDHELGFNLASRNLSLAPPGRPLLAACPSCFLRLKQTHMDLKEDAAAREEYRTLWGQDFNPDLQIINLFDLLSPLVDTGAFSKNARRLAGLTFVPYYGCMLARPPAMRKERNFHGMMEKILVAMGAEPVSWNHTARCCGTFLSVSRPDIAATSVEKIMDGAVKSGADCIVTACAMCHLNLEIRSQVPLTIPVLYFSELLALSMGIGDGKGWFSRHLIDPRPLLRSKKLILS